MSGAGSTARVIAGAVVVAFVLLIAAVWASGASAAASLALTGGLVLIGAGVLSLVASSHGPKDSAPDQHDRMQGTPP